MRKFKAVLFDMDGIVIDSEFYWSRTEGEFAAKHSLAYTNRYRRRIMALSPVEIVQVLRGEFGLREPVQKIRAERNQLAVEIYEKKAKLLPGFLSLLKKIKKQ